MPLTRPLPGLALDTTVRTVAENPAGSGEIRTLEFVWVNVDGVASCNINVARRAGATGVREVLPVGYPLEAFLTVSRVVVLAPGDRLESASSAPGDIVVDVQQIFAEPAS